jgi:hypothetical protein
VNARQRVRDGERFRPGNTLGGSFLRRVETRRRTLPTAETALKHIGWNIPNAVRKTRDYRVHKRSRSHCSSKAVDRWICIQNLEDLGCIVVQPTYDTCIYHFKFDVTHSSLTFRCSSHNSAPKLGIP